MSHETQHLEKTAHQTKRLADAMELLVEEMAYQNAVLAELAHAQWSTAISANEYTDPDERVANRPSLRRLHTNIEDQRFTREEKS